MARVAGSGRQWVKGLRLESLCLFPREQQEKAGPWGREAIQAPQGPQESRD